MTALVAALSFGMALDDETYRRDRLLQQFADLAAGAIDAELDTRNNLPIGVPL